MRKPLILRGGTLLPMDGPAFVGDILLKDGRIAALGAGLSCDGAETVDAAGRFVLPGLVDAHTHIGLMQSGSRERDHNELTAPVVPHARAIDAIDPLDIAFAEARAGGVTTCVTGPGSMNLIGGTFAAVKTSGNTVEKMLLRDAVGMKAALGENPKTYAPNNPAYPKSRLGVAAKLRETLVAAQNYGQHIAMAERDPHLFVPRDLAMEALLPVLRRELPLKVHVHRHNDIMTAIRICEEFQLRYTLDHCTNGYLLTDELSAALQNGCDGVILGPFGIYKGKPESDRRNDYKAPNILYGAGIPFAIMTDFYETQPDSLITHAALSAAEGLPEQAAMESVTINPARIVGIDDRVGSLTVGKDADVAVFSHAPLDMKAKCVLTVINGEIAYTRTR